jgi:translocation and assembly module TamB
MSRRARTIWIAAAGLVVVVLLAALSLILVLRSGWLREKIRQRMVAEVEKATGGRAEIGAFQFDWERLRAEVDGFVLHGNEPPDAPPLLRADSIVVGIKIVSFLERTVDVQYLDVRHPQVYLIRYPDGHTNVPAPKVKQAGNGTVETILDLAIGRFGVQDGSFEVHGQGKTPFGAGGRNLRAQFTYDKAGPRYRGQVSVAPADFEWGGFRPVPLDVRLELAVERNRIQIDSGRVATAQSQAEFSGSIDSLVSLSGSFAYKARVALAEVNRTLAGRTQLAGPVTLAGNLRFRGAADYLATGSLHAAGLSFQPDPHFTLRDFNADGAVKIDPRRIEVTGMRLSGLASATLTGTGGNLAPIPLSGRMETVVLRQRTLEATGIRLELMGGSFAGHAQLADLKHVRVEGEVEGFDARHMMRVYNGQSVPWDGAASGPVELSVSLGRASTLQVRGRMAIEPAGAGAPVHGAIDATYDGESEALDLGRSFLTLPSTRVDFTGVLGQRLEVHVDSRNLDDALPAFDIQSLPVKLRNGEAIFDGTIAGRLDDPHIAGHGRATNVVWSGRTFNALSADLDLASTGLSVRNGSLQSGTLRVLGSGSLGMRDWHVEDAGAISAAGSIHNAPAADLLAMADVKGFPVEGTIDADGSIAGTYGDPRIDATFTATNGAIDAEPFDRFTGTLNYSGRTIEMANAQLAAGGKQLKFQAHYAHQPGSFGNGQLRFQVESNEMPLNEFQTIRREYPGIHGSAEVHVAGLVEVAPAKPGQPGFHVTNLNGALHARGLRLNDQPLRDVTLTATTKGGDLVAHFDSELAGSIIQGDGKWRLADDYPGGAQISFKGLDLTRLRAWLAGGNLPGGLQLVGSAEGTLSISGPAIEPDLWKAELRMPTLLLGPGGDLAAKGAGLALHNPAPIVITLEHGVAKVESARLVGRSTDLSLTGTVNLKQKNPLDLHVSGRFDLASLADFNQDIYGAGSMETGVTIRGPLAQPLVNGRLDIKDATVNLADIPVGVYKANGVILFDSSRATIQSFSGESGGGQVTLSGFAGYSGDVVAFRLHATAHEMRVRFPEDFTTVTNASLNLTGASDSSTLSGRITVLRTGFNPHSDFSSVLAKSAEPVRTPSAQTGLLGNMHFDVQVDTAPDITFESSLAQGLQVEASLRLRGTGSNPSLLGRINVTQGQIVFFGTTFTINEGSIAFYNPVRIDPVLNVDLETKARGISVILNISGPINKLNLTPRSDPPMPLADILALLATGRSPTSDYATLMASPASPQSMQQLGASALLGQAIASPVTGRLQRFFGVTRLKIDPTVTNMIGAESTAQARLTVEQQVTPEITFTYITDVTSTNPLVIQVEWAFSRKWSAVLLREENGLLGLNFVYKRRFK